jgi:16S rRNA C967 or C1407 C5-methylase (RsmB/RsmF family)/NOL1/NOP2/fmu family ribosome biogenesis protein
VQLPQSLLNSLQDAKGFYKEAFEKVHSSGEQITSIRINPSKPSNVQNLQSKIGWSEYGYYLASRPSFTFDPLFHAGCYYVQEASSMFLEQALKQTVDLTMPLKVLDLCAAPGGKSTHIQSLLSKESLLVSNEVIKSRNNILRDNIIKWGCENVVVTNNDPNNFAKLENYFDVMVVDAPCSGSGLFRRDPEAMQEWSDNNVKLCSQRQQRILADVLPALKKGGILVYSTCSYSKEEDEDIVGWLCNKMSLVNCPLDIEPTWGIVESDGGYRFWPDQVQGEGFFICCFKKIDGEEEPDSWKPKVKTDVLSKNEISFVNKWLCNSHYSFVRSFETIYAWPQHLADDFQRLLQTLRVTYSGVRVGELIRDKVIPDHALAMSRLVADHIPVAKLDVEQAIRYLQRKDMHIDLRVKGWQTVSFDGHTLGWINALNNRINNYYPKELRILKDV